MSYPHLSEAVPQLATTAEVALLLHRHPRTVTRMCREGRLPATKFGQWLINLALLSIMVGGFGRN
jgi:excisionase family DNA binding protein